MNNPPNDEDEINNTQKKALKSQIESLKNEFHDPTFSFIYIYYGDNFEEFKNYLYEKKSKTQNTGTYFILSSIEYKDKIKFEIK